MIDASAPLIQTRSVGSPQRGPLRVSSASQDHPRLPLDPTAISGSRALNNSIGRITTTGIVTNYTGTGISAPWGIAAGPDGTLWFTNPRNSSIGRITTAGAVTNYHNPQIGDPYDIAAGPDGALWFTSYAYNAIGRISTAGYVITYSDPGISGPYSVTAGPDGAVWLTNYSDDTIGRITPPHAPGAPTVFSAVPYPNATAKVIWRAPADHGGTAIEGYRVTPYLGSVAQPTRVFDSAATSEMISGLQDGKT